MKKILSISVMCLSTFVFSQVRIGSASSNVLSSSSVLLEFGDTKDKGLVLPYVEVLPTEGSQHAKGGTLVFDITSTGEYRVKVKNENSGWSDLSGQSGYSSLVESRVKTPQRGFSDITGAKTIIGTSETTTDGVLVLESADKAMVLPIVDDYKNIKNPSAGMIAFLKGATASGHRLLVFNGQTWSFWKP
ncbi:hypothetical protein JSO56_00130 [Riemerella anatipestifer]|uniref:hypothetical protein n=1 Tax=Riemerella anatipestifer TaxID=34085 RepID=UPI0030BC4038